MNINDRLVGFPSRQSVEQFHEAHGGFAIWLDPFGMLDPQVVVNLFAGVRCRCGFDETWQLASVKDSSVLRNGSSKASPEQSTNGGAVERAPTIPKDGTRLLAACATPGRLDHFSALALQQNGQQSALRKGRR